MDEKQFVGFGPASDGSGYQHTINHLPVAAEWDDIYQIETGDYVVGGQGGVSNLPHRQLANRTEWLKQQAEQLLQKIEAADPSHFGTQIDELRNEIKQLGASSENNRINHLERLVGNLYQAIQSANIDPDGYDNALFETFNDGAQEIDQTVVNVTSIVSGDDSIDVANCTSLIIGAHYQLTDGEKTEEVQIKSINVSGDIKRVVLMHNVKNQYAEGRARLYRSSVAIVDGRAYGSGNMEIGSWEPAKKDALFSGSDTQVAVNKKIDYTDLSAFNITGGTIVNGKLQAGGPAIGIALVQEGSRTGTWARIDDNGDDFIG